MVKRVFVAGAGLMGHGIAQVHAVAGIEVDLYEPVLSVAGAGLERIGASLDRSLSRGRIDGPARGLALDRIHATARLEDVAAAELAIEAVYEDLEVKGELFRALDAAASSSCLFVTNTSSLSVDRLAEAVGRERRTLFAGMHFFSPVPAMPLVEIVRGSETAQATINLLQAHADMIGKRAILCSDRPGFVVNRLLVPFLAEAMRAYQEHVASAEDIDAGARLGLHHPMGPLQLADFIGLDILVNVFKSLHDEYQTEQFQPPSVLLELVAAGHLGQKTGRGFHSYPR